MQYIVFIRWLHFRVESVVLKIVGKEMNIYTKVISGSSLRKSRLHNEKGGFVSLKNIITHGPLAIGTGLLRVTIGYRPILPWIAYTSINMLKCVLNKKSRVLEFGSGMSTIWYAKHAGEVFSVEDYLPWYEKITNVIKVENIDNITYTFVDKESDYYGYMSENVGGFDLVMVDGLYRSKCISNASKLVRPGGILYLDNSDKDSTPHGGDIRIAESMLRNLARELNVEVNEITDFAPTQFFVQEGLFIKYPS